jgi:2-polyprenyl-6-hydroxyphenyl methylase/3-demethylubiquinone-9 3-methyltransferase
MTAPRLAFGFGRNWLSYSERALDQDKVKQARAAFGTLFQDIAMRDRRFLDIGFGQGLGLFLAQEAGADVLGIDVDPLCAAALDATHRFFPALKPPRIQLVSILDPNFLREQGAAGGFDIVHSWGVLHHTGQMWNAIRNAAALVKDDGIFVISIYNRHWSSPLWRIFKFIFNHLPRFLQEVSVAMLHPIFRMRARALAKEETSRGMDLRHDIRDWLGGYPYEYAGLAEVRDSIARLGFDLVRCHPTLGFTGCNEFVFHKSQTPRTMFPRSGGFQPPS